MKRKATSHKLCILFLTMGYASLFAAPPAHASDVSNFAHMSRGIGRILGAAFQVPRYLLQKTLNEPLGLGTVDGALTGTYYAVSEVVQGTLETAAGAAPYAKYAVFFI